MMMGTPMPLVRRLVLMIQTVTMLEKDLNQTQRPTVMIWPLLRTQVPVKSQRMEQTKTVMAQKLATSMPMVMGMRNRQGLRPHLKHSIVQTMVQHRLVLQPMTVMMQTCLCTQVRQKRLRMV
jgi:hypothetical protein